MDVKSVQCDVCKIAAKYIQQFAEKNVTEVSKQLSNYMYASDTCTHRPFAIALHSTDTQMSDKI